MEKMEGNGRKMEGNGREMEGNGREMEGNGNSKTKMEEKWKEMEMFASPPPCPPHATSKNCLRQRGIIVTTLS